MFKNSTKNKMSDKSNHHENKIRIFELKENSFQWKAAKKEKIPPPKKTIRTTTTKNPESRNQS